MIKAIVTNSHHFSRGVCRGKNYFEKLNIKPPNYKFTNEY